MEVFFSHLIFLIIGSAVGAVIIFIHYDPKIKDLKSEIDNYKNLDQSRCRHIADLKARGYQVKFREWADLAEYLKANWSRMNSDRMDSLYKIPYQFKDEIKEIVLTETAECELVCFNSKVNEMWSMDIYFDKDYEKTNFINSLERKLNNRILGVL